MTSFCQLREPVWYTDRSKTDSGTRIDIRGIQVNTKADKVVRLASNRYLADWLDKPNGSITLSLRQIILFLFKFDLIWSHTICRSDVAFPPTSYQNDSYRYDIMLLCSIANVFALVPENAYLELFRSSKHSRNLIDSFNAIILKIRIVCSWMLNCQYQIAYFIL